MIERKPPSRMPEALLLRAYGEDPDVARLTAWRKPKETRPCACRGYVTADPEAPFEGVREHQLTDGHADWSKRRGYR